MRLPNPSQRCIIMGSTGRGKTGVGLWHLLKRNFENRTIIIVDHKRDENLSKLKAENLKIGSPAPNDGGVYIIRPVVDVHDEQMTKLFREMWDNENYLLYIDELTMINRNCPALKALLTQGRSKQIEIIMLTQRPVDVSRYAFSEADFIQVLGFNDVRDSKKVFEMTGVDMSGHLAPFHSFWYDRAKNELLTVAPVDMLNELVKAVNRKILGECYPL